MPRNPDRRNDLLSVVLRMQEEIRQLRSRGKGHTESKNMVVGGDIAAGLVIPRFQVGIDYDDRTPEWKKLVGFRGHVESGGPVTLDWYLSGVLVATGHTLTTTLNENEVVLDPPINLADKDDFKIVVTGAGTGADMCATVVFVTGAL